MILNRPDFLSISKLGIKIFEILVIKFPYLKGNYVVSASLKLVLIPNADMTLKSKFTKKQSCMLLENIFVFSYVYFSLEPKTHFTILLIHRPSL